MLEEADFQEDNREGVDVLIYTRTKIGRPWLGCVLRKIDNQFTIQWYDRRKGDVNTFFALENPDGTPYTSDLDTGTVILWNFSSRIDDASFTVNSFFLDKFKEEYCRHDASNI